METTVKPIESLTKADSNSFTEWYKAIKRQLDERYGVDPSRQSIVRFADGSVSVVDNAERLRH